MSKTQGRSQNPTIKRFDILRRKYAERFKPGPNYRRALWDTIMDASRSVGQEDWESADYWLDQFERIVAKHGLGETWRDDIIADYQRNVWLPERGEHIPDTVLTQGDLEDWRRAEYVRLHPEPEVGAS